MDMKQLLECLEDFESFCGFIKEHTPESVLEIAGRLWNGGAQALSKMEAFGFSRVQEDDGSFSKGGGIYLYVIYDLHLNIDKYSSVYYNLSDDASRTVFMNQIRGRILPLANFAKAAFDVSGGYPQYFDKDILRFSEDEVFVDCGAYTGDTAAEFIEHCNNKYKCIYLYEPAQENIALCRENLADYKDIVFRQAGVGSKPGKMTFSGGANNYCGSFIPFYGSGADAQSTLEIVRLDDDISQQVTFVKMDVEGYEPEAIAGAAALIKRDRPKLAVCLYHMVSDIWEIPCQIMDINPDYKLYMRQYSKKNYGELILYAV